MIVILTHLFTHSTEDATLTESIELRALGPINSTDTDPGLIADSDPADPFNYDNNNILLGAQSPSSVQYHPHDRNLIAHREVVNAGAGDTVTRVQSPPNNNSNNNNNTRNISDRRDTIGSGEQYSLDHQHALQTIAAATAAAAANNHPPSSSLPPVLSCVSTPRHSNNITSGGHPHRRWESVSPMTLSPPGPRRSPSYMRSMNRIASDNSIQSLSTDAHKDGLASAQTTPRRPGTSNLRDELLNCEQKELFQFLHDDFDNSHNYFSDTMGLGAAVLDPDTDSLVFDGRGGADGSLASDRKVSTGSLRSNLSSISNSIFQTLEMRRGGSFSGSIDKVITRLESPSMRKRFSDNLSQKDVDREPLVGNSDFDCLIESFDKSLTDLKKKSSLSLDRNAKFTAVTNIDEISKSNSSSNNSAPDAATVIRRPRSGSARTFDRNSNSVKLKRRSLEKQNKVHDEEFEVAAPQAQGPVGSRDNIVNKSPPTSNGSPTMRIRRAFNNSYDRIKRSSLIERVEEELDGERMPLRVESEKLPRKEFRINDELLKRHHSDEMVKPEVTATIKTPVESSPPIVHQHRKDSRPSLAYAEVQIANMVTSPTDAIESPRSGKSSSSSKKSKKSKKSPKSGKADEP